MDQMHDTHERLATLEANDRNIFHQLDTLKLENKEIRSELKDIRKLTEAVAQIAVKTENIDQKIDNINNRLNEVEQAPAKDYTHYRRTIISGAITGVIGIILGALLSLIIH